MPAPVDDGAAAPGLAAPERARVHAADMAPLGAAGAAPAGLIGPQKDEALGWQAEGDEVNTEPNGLHSAQTAPGLQPEGDAQADGKRFSTLQAQLALRGFTLDRAACTSGPATYTVTRWGLVRELASLDDVTAFAIRVGVPA